MTGTGAARVGIVMGSDSDLEVLLEAARMLDALKVAYEMTVASAHRGPERTRRGRGTGGRPDPAGQS